jgi:small subunit ribosomal protein S16
VAVKIKLKRLGKIRAPYYRIVVADSRTKRDGRAIEEIGKYHPKAEPSLIEVDSERAQHWLTVGAQPTDPVRKILEITGDWQKFKGLPGAEGTLKTAAPRADKKVAFAAATAESLAESGAKTKPKGKADTKAADAKAADTKAADTKAADTKAADTKPAEAKTGDAKVGSARGGRAAARKTSADAAAEGGKQSADATEAKPVAEAQAETQAEAQAEAPAATDASADAEPGTAAEIPAEASADGANADDAGSGDAGSGDAGSGDAPDGSGA